MSAGAHHPRGLHPHRPALDKNLNAVHSLYVLQDGLARLRAVPDPVDGEPAPAPDGRRARTRLRRHRAYLRSALAIVTQEGLEALTMARLADEADAAVGTVYTYFPSKAALVAEVQREAIETLGRSYLLGRARLDERLHGVADDEAALARLAGFVRFWIAAFDAFPQEARLNAMLLAQPTGMEPADAARVVPAALRLLDEAADCHDAAVAAGALSPADSTERVVTLAAAVTGVVQLDTLAPLDPDLFDGARLAAGLADDLFVSWGARRPALHAALAHVDRLAALGGLAPAVPDHLPEEP